MYTDLILNAKIVQDSLEDHGKIQATVRLPTNQWHVQQLQ